jgi:hypothetical protein
MENSTDAFHKTCTNNKDICRIFALILETSQRQSTLYAIPLPTKQNTTFARSTMHILEVWNKDARLITNSPSGL